MSKLILISGENGSGKSRFAEQTAAKIDRKRYYIATMRPVTEENRIRIERHRRQREDLDFETLELPLCITKIPFESGSLVLLEDVSNLLANVLFEKGSGADEVFKQMMALNERCGVLIAVTISNFDYTGDDRQTLEYISSLKRLNQMLLEESRAAILMKNGTPLLVKGDMDDLY